MRLEAMLLPDALHGRVADADLLGQHACAPVRCVLGLLLGCTLHDRDPHLGTDRLLAGARALAPVLEQALDATIHVGFLASAKPSASIPEPRAGCYSCRTRDPTAAQCVRVQRFSAASCHQRRAAPVSSGHWA